MVSHVIYSHAPIGCTAIRRIDAMLTTLVGVRGGLSGNAASNEAEGVGSAGLVAMLVHLLSTEFA